LQPRHLNRLFHQYFGFSVGALRMEMRLLKAVSLLRDVNAKVINVAAQCGFNHLGLFNTCFKRRFGVTPGCWRKQAALEKSRRPPCRGRIQPARCKPKVVSIVGRQAENSVSPASKIPPLKKSPGARTLPDMRAAEQVIEHHAPLAFPRRATPCR